MSSRAPTSPNLILARTVRREGELAIHAALGANKGALRRMLLAESLLLCGTGAAVGVMSAQPLVAILARYASRFSVRALDLTVDSSLLWAGAALAIVAAVILAFVPRLPTGYTSNGLSLTSGGVRITDGTNRRQQILAVTQNRRILRVAGRRKYVDRPADCTAKGSDRFRHTTRPRHQRSCHAQRKNTSTSGGLLQGSDSSR